MRFSMNDYEAKFVLEDEAAASIPRKSRITRAGSTCRAGIWLIKRPFDVAAYNDKGNVLTLFGESRGDMP